MSKWKEGSLVNYWKRKAEIKKLKNEMKKLEKSLSKVTFNSLKYCLTEADSPQNLKFTVYQLHSPKTGKPIYVGSTAFSHKRSKLMESIIFN